MRSGDRENYDKDNEEEWWHIHLAWIASARRWLFSQLGQPKRIDYPHLFDEHKKLSKEQLKVLRSWGYTCPWGTIDLAYESLDMLSEIWIQYDSVQQISNWDELAIECESRIEIERSHNGKSIHNFAVTQSLIDILRQHFDFNAVKPLLYERGIVFDLRHWKTRAVLEVSLEQNANKFHISRHDSTRTAQVNDENSLIDMLHLFLETEKL